VETSQLPSSWAQWLTAVRRQLRFYRKTWRFVGLLGFVLLIGVVGTVLSIAYNDSGTGAGDYFSGIAGNLPTFGIIVCAFIGGDAIAMDFGSGTGYFTLVLPVRRIVLLLGRYAAAFLASFALLLVFYAFGLFGDAWFYGVAAIPWLAVAESIGLTGLFALATLSTAFFFSSFFRSPAVSMVVTILVLFLGFVILDGALSVTTVEPWFSLLYAGGAIALPFEGQPHESVLNTMGSRGLSLHTWNPYLWEGALIMLAYFVAFLVISCLLYQYKESKG
jgi:ABC-type transport system involved in multi-copper enzyme maturation permease subunit